MIWQRIQNYNSISNTLFRGVINGKAGEAAALPNFSDTLTLSQPRGADYAQPLALPHLKFSDIMPLLFTEIIWRGAIILKFQ